MKALSTYFPELSLICSNTAACTAKGISRTNNNGITYFICKCKGRVNISYYITFNDRLICTLHKLLKAISVLALLNGGNGCTDNIDIIFIKYTLVIQLTAKIKACLAAHTCNNTVWSFLSDYLFYKINGKRLNVGIVCHTNISHNCSRVGVNKYYLNSLLLK